MLTLPLRPNPDSQFDLSLSIPFLKAALTDLEYQLITSVAADNFAEVPALPPGASWLNDHYQAILAEQQQALTAAHTAAVAAQAQAALAAAGGASPRAVAAAAPQAAEPEGEAAAAGPVPASQDASPTSVRCAVGASGCLLLAAYTLRTTERAGLPDSRPPTRPTPTHQPKHKRRVVVSLGEIELELRRHLELLPAPQPLARFTVADLWVSFRNSQQVGSAAASRMGVVVTCWEACCAGTGCAGQPGWQIPPGPYVTPTPVPTHPPTHTPQGSMFVSVCVPRVEARDLRPEVPLEQSLVISSGHKASFLMLDVSA